jgi:flagellar biosynthesis/type III secretory pathway protein FliH
MALSRGRIVRGDGSATLEVGDTITLQAQGRIVARRIVEAEREGTRVTERAHEQAAAILAEAREKTKTAREDAAREGKNEASAALAAHWLATRADEQKVLASAEDRVIGLARALAERLLGRELLASPETVVSLARVALSSAARARRVVLKAHPDDVEALRAGELGGLLEGASLEIVADASRGIGCVRIETDIGVLDGDLAPQLDRLVAALRG